MKIIDTAAIFMIFMYANITHQEELDIMKIENVPVQPELTHNTKAPELLPWIKPTLQRLAESGKRVRRL